MGVFDEVKERVTAREVMERAGIVFNLITCADVRFIRTKQRA